jgi:hypothetical protein
MAVPVRPVTLAESEALLHPDVLLVVHWMMPDAASVLPPTDVKSITSTAATKADPVQIETEATEADVLAVETLKYR